MSAERKTELSVTEVVQRSLFGLSNINSPEAYHTWLDEADMLTKAEGMVFNAKQSWTKTANQEAPVKLCKHPILIAFDNLVSLLKRAS
ncbi:MAG: hypothetical protein Q7R44_00300 [bacterium]|nr:hypothetical protein [bacterium]